MNKVLIAILAIVIIVGGYVWSVNNKLITMGESVDNKWAQVETQYQRRFDLIPNLVASVKGQMTQEQKVFGDIADARTRYSSANGADQKAKAANEVEGALSRLLVVMENYPELKSSEAVQTLMAQLEGTENRISVERSRYNEEVQNYNIIIKKFPTNLIAGMLGHSSKTYFQAAAGSENAPKVNL